MKFASGTLPVLLFLCSLVQVEKVRATMGMPPPPPPAFIPIDHKGEPASSGITYMRNDGQVTDLSGVPNTEVMYYSWGGYPKVAAMRDNVVSMNLERVDTIPTTLDSAWSLQFKPSGENVNPNVVPEAYEEVNEVHNFFLSHCPNGIMNVPGFKRIVYKGIYPDIDMHLYSNPYGLKIYFVFNPGADPEDLFLEFSGQDSIRFDLLGHLKIYLEQQYIRLPEALAYQEINGTTQLVSWGIDYQNVNNDDLITFDFAAYNPAYPLILDISASLGNAMTFGLPPEWGTYFGDARTDVARNMIMLNNGEHLACGHTNSPNFPVTPGAFQLDYDGMQDAFYSHFGTGYNRLYTTFYGGSGIDRFEQLCAAPDQQSVYLVGTSRSTDIPTTSFSPNCFQDGSNEGESVILARFDLDPLNPDVLWQTYFGPRSIVPTGMVTDETGNLYIAGYVQTYDGYEGETSCEGTDGTFPYCSFGGGAYYQDFFGGGFIDGFFARFNTQLELVHSSLFGGALQDAIYSLALDDGLQQLYFGGWTLSPRTAYTNCQEPTNSGFPLCNPGSGFFQDDLNFTNTSNNETDGMLGSIDIGSGALSWSSFVGSSASDVVGDIVVDDVNHKLYATGFTLATGYAGNTCAVPANGGFPECHGGNQYPGAIAGGVDLFLQKYDLATRALEWSTVIGGSEREEPRGLALTAEEDGTRTLVVGGFTWSGTMGSSSIPLQFDQRFYWQEEHADAAATDATHDDGFVYVFDEEQQMVLGTYFGGWGNDLVMAVGGYSTRLYLTGTALSTDDFPFNCPPTPDPYCDQSYLNTQTGTSDVFHAQIQYDLTIGAEDLQVSAASLIVLGPNPTSGDLFVRLHSGSLPTDLMVQVVDGAGRICLAPTLASTKANGSLYFDLQDLAPGFFVVQMTSARTGLRVAWPLIIER